MRRVSNAQVSKLMEEMSKHGCVGVAAMKAGMDRKTARKCVVAPMLRSEMTVERTWRTRPDPFIDVWPEVEQMLVDEPGLETKTVFEALQLKHPDRFVDGQLRSLQRKVRQWRSSRGPDKAITFAQRHRPGEAAQTDFTSTGELKVTVAGAPYEHLLCNMALPYSNWRWSTVCLSESMAAIRRGVQRALFQWGRVPEWHQTDNSTAATHRIPSGKGSPSTTQNRTFNVEYVALMKHFGMKPRDAGRCQGAKRRR